MRTGHLDIDGRPAGTVEIADTYLRRLRGMLGRRRLPEALLLVPGGSVHGLGMGVSLDVALLVPMEPLSRSASLMSTSYVAVGVSVLRPFGLIASRRGVRAVLESPVGTFGRWGLRPGSVVQVGPWAHGSAPVRTVD